MLISTKLPFPSLFFRHWNADGIEMGVLLVKGSFHLDEGERSRRLLRPQPEVVLTDLFHGEANRSPLRQESELAPFKPKTDVTFNAVAHSPEAKELESWPVRFEVKTKLSYGFHVFGERFWEASRTVGGRKWKLSSARTIKELPLTYAYAYGGTAKIGEEDEETVHPYNPVGRGLLSDHLLSRGEAVAAPQIGLQGEVAAARPDEPMTVCGCGPLTKSWLPRLSLAGTFDEAWRRERHPRMPEDYDYAYWNGAPLPLQVEPYLQGDETIELTGLRHEAQPYTFGLPGAMMGCRIVREGSGEPEERRLNLDTVHCDIADANPQKHWMSLTWRLTLSDPDDIREVELFARRVEGVEA